tara:strand:- start:664 stop:1905 length:1242 start_codon:yes stop_codon:yes gene_type:complete
MKKKNCRLCGSKKLKKFLDLGLQPPSDQFLSIKEIDEPNTYYPLEVNTCMSCGFKQLGYVVDKKILYQKDYPYESSLTKSGLKHFKEFAASVTKKFNLSKEDLVIDIGSNVGILLNFFKKQKIRVLGVDPASNICKIANAKGIKTIDGFFDNNISSKIIKKYGHAKIITGTNVFAHIDDLKQLLKNISKVLDKKKGVFIIEVPHFLNLIKDLEYDTIYHEHLSYITIIPLIKFLKKINFQIIDVEKKDIHGGSIRIFISRIGNYKISKNVGKFVDLEKKGKVNNINILNNFAEKVYKNRMKLINLLTNLKLKNKKIAILSTPAKGMTLMNYCKIDKDYVDFATEKSNLKIGKFTPGCKVKIYSDKYLLSLKPDYALILAWNFSKEIISNNIHYLKKGGKFIIPIPRVRIIGKK